MHVTDNCAIENFKLWDADRDVVVDEMFDGTTEICKEDFRFSIEAIATSDTCESVDFELTGPDGFYYTRSEGRAKWMLFGNSGDDIFGRIDSIPVGDFTLTVFGKGGVKTSQKVVNFTVKNCDPAPVCEIERVLLWDANNNVEVVDGELGNGPFVICNDDFDAGYNIEAVASDCGSVFFEVTGDNGYVHDRNERTAAYFAWGNKGADVFGVTLDGGMYELTAFGNGEASLATMVEFEVVEDCGGGGSPACEITGFELWDAENNVLIDENFDMGEICNTDFTAGYNIKAVTPSSCDRVTFEVSGVDNGYSHYQTENNAPYFTWGNTGENVLGETLSAGGYVLVAFANGDSLLEKTLAFDVVDTCM